MGRKKTPLVLRMMVKVGSTGKRIIPGGVRAFLKQRIFYAIFQTTRVTNDAYGWRPEEKGDGR